MVITEKEIKDKAIIKNFCEDEEKNEMVVSELVRMSEDKVTRQAYQRRQDEIILQHRKDRRLTELENENEKLRLRLAELEAQIKK